MTSNRKRLTLWPIEAWGITDEHFDRELNQLKESLFSLANGYIGTRGTFEEGLVNDIPSCEGTYLNGLYYQQPIAYGESAHGFATHNDQMLKVANGKGIFLSIDGEDFRADGVETSLHRNLDIQSAMLTRKQNWRTPSGKELHIEIKRLVSLENQHLLAIDYNITALNFDGEAELISTLDANEQQIKNAHDPRVGELSLSESLTSLAQYQQDSDGVLIHQVVNQKLMVASAIGHEIPSNCRLIEPVKTNSVSQPENKIEFHLRAQLKQNAPLSIKKYVVYCHQNAGDLTTLKRTITQILSEVKSLGFEHFRKRQADIMQAFWQNSDLVIDGDNKLQQGIRFNQFSLFQSVGRDGLSNIGAKGLTGPGYDGHYFWDSEIYVLPALVYGQPEIARAMLTYRYRTLDKARQRAREMSHPVGALYPWRTISGDESSAFFPAGTAQYHINAAIAFAIRTYFFATNDWNFMRQMGAEMLVETARIWLDTGHFSARHSGKFCIDEVTGPDEYTALNNNNFYTNAMAALHLQFTIQIINQLESDDSQAFHQLKTKIQLHKNEVDTWQKAAEQMYLPYDERLKINPQDDAFLDKKIWDFTNTPEENFPLLLHYHPLIIYRHQVLKQADVVLAMFLLDQQFPLDLKKRNLDYYEPLTTHDSTLSSCIHSIEYAETGDVERAYDFFQETARMDLDNFHGNTEHGVHIASMAGTWMAMVNGFAGLRVRETYLYFAPKLPAHWKSMQFKLRVRGSLISICITQDTVKYQLQSGPSVKIAHREYRAELSAAAPLILSAADGKPSILATSPDTILPDTSFHKATLSKDDENV